MKKSNYIYDNEIRINDKQNISDIYAEMKHSIIDGHC